MRGSRKGADVASWRQAARAELAASSNQFDCGCILLDLVKAFERFPYDWLVSQAGQYKNPLIILRLSIAVYQLGRVIVVDGICALLGLALFPLFLAFHFWFSRSVFAVARSVGGRECSVGRCWLLPGRSMCVSGCRTDADRYNSRET